MPSLCYRIDIIGHTWTIFFLTKSQFIKKYENHCLGVTEPDERAIFLRIDKLSLETIIHELMHGYLSEHNAHTMQLSPDQMEELCCDITAKYAAKLVEQGEQIIHAYKVLRGRRVR
jgi:phage gp36-like protein